MNMDPGHVRLMSWNPCQGTTLQLLIYLQSHCVLKQQAVYGLPDLWMDYQQGQA